MKIKEKKLSSELIKAESTQWFMDTALSTAVLVAFLIAMLLENTKLNFLNSYVDPFMTLIVSILYCVFELMLFGLVSFEEMIDWLFGRLILLLLLLLSY